MEAPGAGAGYGISRCALTGGLPVGGATLTDRRHLHAAARAGQDQVPVRFAIRMC
jgi:hypothetical protein